MADRIICGYCFLSVHIDLDQVVDDLAYLLLVLREIDHVEKVCLQHDRELVRNILCAALLHLLFL